MEEAIGKRGKARHSVVQKKKKEEKNEIGTSVDQRTPVVESEVTLLLHFQAFLDLTN